MFTYLLFALGFVFLIKGADFLVDGGSSLARRFGVSSLVIGLTIVSFGTSAPELLVNIIASFQGNTDIAIGNILGSNIANLLLILGIAAMIRPLAVQKSTTRNEIPLNMLSGLLLLVIANDVLVDGAAESILTRSDGLILIAFFAIFMAYTVSIARAEHETDGHYKKMGVLSSIGLAIFGCVMLAYGGKWVVDGATAIARTLGLSEALIGLTIVAVGTSLPELATSAVAAYRNQVDIAVGNVVGSNLFNIFWVLGLSSTIRPLPFNTMINLDILVYLLATVLLFLFMFIGVQRQQLSRWQGGTFIAMYAAYIVFLVLRG